MLDFVDIVVDTEPYHKNAYDAEIYPSFYYGYTNDIVLKGGRMIGFWNPNKNAWDTKKNDFVRYVDGEIKNEYGKIKESLGEAFKPSRIKVKYMGSVSSRVMDDFERLEKKSQQHDDVIFNKKIFFKDDAIKKGDYSTTQLDYRPEPGETPVFDEFMEVLYDQREIEKILWFMGAVFTGHMPTIQKGMFLYGPKGTGKGTVIKIVRDLFQEYCGVINLKKLTSDGEFATSQIDTVPILIDDETNLSVIKNDTELLKLMSHDPIEVNKKYGIPYTVTFTGLLIAASNQRYRVRNMDAGITRRFVTVEPKGNKHSGKRYNEMMQQMPFEYPQLAQRAIDHFNAKGPHYYDNYIDMAMVEYSDPIYRFVVENHNQLKDGITWKRVAMLYHAYLEGIGFDTKDYKNKIKAGLYPTYMDFASQKKVNGVNVSSWFFDLKEDLIFPSTDADGVEIQDESDSSTIELKEQPSYLDRIGASYSAQLANEHGTPSRKWDSNKTIMSDLDTSELHYVILPLHHIVIDFDIKNDQGEKELSLNLEAAKKFPPTYTELSKSGQGVHLHYYYDGNVEELERLYEEDVEIKVFLGKASLRRQLTKCNDLPIKTISHGLPVKGKEKMYKAAEIIKWDEKKLRRSIERNLAKQIHANTKPSIDLIQHSIRTAEEDGVQYDLSDMYQDLLIFAMSSSNQAEYCLSVVNKLNLCTIESEEIDNDLQGESLVVPDKDIHFYDIEVYPNLFVVVYKRFEEDEFTVLLNPKPEELEGFFDKPMVGFNNRNYDNQIMYYAMLGESPMELYHRSKSIIVDKDRNVTKYKAKEMSYADIYEYVFKKQSLKKWQIELDIHHDEIEFPWDQPVAEADWDRVIEYCKNDVEATEAVFKANYADYRAQCILSEISGLSVNSTHNEHSARIMFGEERNPNVHFKYTDLSEMFPGYEFNRFAKKSEASTYLGEFVGEGGAVRTEPGIWFDVALLDVASMHPTSAIELDYFGMYTQILDDLKQARIHIKHEDYDKAKEMFDGKFKRYLGDKADAKGLSNALKLVINSIYGLTSASFYNKFSQKLNVDNIVAKRGALFMLTLKEEIEKRGYVVAHIKTDSVKIPNADQKIIDFVHEFGKQYGYDFEHEKTYRRLVLLNKAVYAGEYLKENRDNPELSKWVWEFTGGPILEPYVQKKLFTHTEMSDKEFRQIKEVSTGKDGTPVAIYLGDKRVGRFAGVYPSLTGEDMWRVTEPKDPNIESKRGHVNGTKGYGWKLWSDYKGKEDIDMQYFIDLAEDMKKQIARVGDPELILGDWDTLVKEGKVAS